MPPHRFQPGPDEMVVSAYLDRGGDEEAQAAWKRAHPDWFVAGSWTPPAARSAGSATGADRPGWVSGGRAPGERGAAWERAAAGSGTALDPASLSVADSLATAATARAGAMGRASGQIGHTALNLELGEGDFPQRSDLLPLSQPAARAWRHEFGEPQVIGFIGTAQAAEDESVPPAATRMVRGVQGDVAARAAAAREAGAALSMVERQGLRELFGQGPQDAKAALDRVSGGQLQLPPGVTRQTLENYASVARSAIDRGIDKIGTQALRLQIINILLGR